MRLIIGYVFQSILLLRYFLFIFKKDQDAKKTNKIYI